MTLVVQINGSNLRVHSTETVTGDGEDKASVVILAEDVCPVVGLVLGLHITLGGKAVDGARSAVVTETEIVPADDIVGQLLLKLIVALEDDECLIHLGNDGSETLRARGGRSKCIDHDPRLTVRVGEVAAESSFIECLSRAERIIVPVSARFRKESLGSRGGKVSSIILLSGRR